MFDLPFFIVLIIFDLKFDISMLKMNNIGNLYIMEEFPEKNALGSNEYLIVCYFLHFLHWFWKNVLNLVDCMVICRFQTPCIFTAKKVSLKNEKIYRITFKIP